MAKRKPPGGRLLRKSRLRKKKRKYVLGMIDIISQWYDKRTGLADLFYGALGVTRQEVGAVLGKPEVTSGSEEQ